MTGSDNKEAMVGVALAASLLLGAATAYAADREVVVSATRIVTDVEEVGSSVTVISGEESERNQQRSVVEVLRDVPGAHVVQLGGPGNQASLFLRGANSNQTLVLIDGMEAMDPSAPAGAFDFGHLRSENIERIEIVRGPQSTLWGSDAIGGVVNIITRKGEGPSSGYGRFEGGSHWTVNPAAGFQGAFGKANVSLDANWFRTEGESITSPRVRPPGVAAERDSYENLGVSGRFGVAIGERVEVSLFTRYMRTDADIDPTAEDPNAQIRQNIYLTRLETKGRFFGGVWEPTLAFDYSRYERKTSDDPDFLSDTFERTRNVGIRTKASLQNDVHLADWNTATVGIETKYDRMNEDRVSLFPAFGAQLIGDTDANVQNNAMFVQDKITLFDQFSGTIGVRRDEHQAFGGKTTWRITPVWRVPGTGTRIKGSYGTGFRAPALFELYGRTLSTFGVFTGNPDLKPEESRGWEVGFDQRLLEGRLSFGATYFRNDIENLIVCDFSTCSNTSDARTRGVETFLTAQVLPRVSVRVAHTYTRAEDARLSSDLLRRPKHKGDVSVTWRPIDPARITASVAALGGQKDVNFNTGATIYKGGYTIFNLYGSYDVDERFGVFARAENLFDRTYEVADGFAGPGLKIMVGLRGRF